MNVQVHWFLGFVSEYPLTSLQFYANERKHLIPSSETMNEETQRDIRHMQWAPLLVRETLRCGSVVRGVQKVLSRTGASEWPRMKRIKNTS